MIHIHTIQHGYPGRHVNRATKFLRSIEHNYLIRVTPLEPIIWRWLLHSWKICGSLPHCVLRAWCINCYKRPTACKTCESAAQRRQLLAHVCGTGQRH